MAGECRTNIGSLPSEFCSRSFVPLVNGCAQESRWCVLGACADRCVAHRFAWEFCCSVGFPWYSRYLPGRSSTGLLSRALGAFAGTRAPTAQLVPEWMGLETSVLLAGRRSFCSAWPPVFACLPPPGSVCASVYLGPHPRARLVGAFLAACVCVFGGPMMQRVRRGGVSPACSGASPEAGLRGETLKAGDPEAG